MVRTSRRLLLVVAAVVASWTGSSRAAEIVWIYPPPNALLTESPVPLLGYVAGAPVDRLAARVVPADADAATARFELYLFKGKVFSGSIELPPGRSNIVVGDAVLPVLYRPGAEADEEDGFRKPRAHGDGVASCNPCHGFSRGELTLKDRVPGLCLGCHEVGTRSLRAVTKQNAHTRSITPDCLGCHEAHTSFEPALLRNGGDPCRNCHDDMAGGRGGHVRAATPACVTCHDPHASAYPALLKGERLPLCKGCHRDVMFPERYPRSFHRPVEEGDCYACHEPHPATPSPGILKKPVPGLCRACHPEPERSAHSDQLEECRLCHQPHRSDRRRLLTGDTTEVCLQCHDDPGAGTHRHPALQEGCITCHDPHRPGGLHRAGRVCGRCHNLRDQGFRRVHGNLPMESVDQCTFCHAPHGSDYPTLLRGTIHYPLKNGGCNACHVADDNRTALKYKGSQTCTRCHGQVTGTSTIVEKDKVHKPVYQIDCTACHNPHLGVRDNFLLEEPDVLCGWCHGLLLKGVENRHGVFDEGGTCYTCHLPHISDFRPLLKRPERELCTRCHTGVIPEDAGARARLHGALTRGRCTGCHNPHATNTDNLLRDGEDALCAGCHGEVTRDGEGRPLAYLHGPVGAGNCTACHLLGHEHRRPGDRFLLARGSAVCARCHDTRVDHVPRRFRAKAREVRGDCLACHLPHGADDPFMMRRPL